MTDDELTAEQQEVAGSAPSAHLLVTAGPGTGKTHTLVARIGYLVDGNDIHPGGILALSFSRAAVGELRRRLRATGEDAGRVTPVTFDSFATRVLHEVDPDGAWTTKSFDGRIAAAIEHVDRFGEFLSEIEHVCVDELQDLVGVRMRFVRALIEQLDVGFTLLGDPAQGIYDFSLADGETAEEDGAPALYRWLRGHFGTGLVERSLTVNHRARSDLALEAAEVGPRVVLQPEEAAEELFDLLASAPRLPSLGSLRNVAEGERTAILCRNNGQALWVSRHLREVGLDHVLQRGATNRSIAPWVAGLVTATGGGVASKARVIRSLEALPAGTPSIDDVWPLLRRVARDEIGIDISRLARRLREGNVPDEMHVARSAPIVVSTVHRSKGLEFDRVVVVDIGWDRPFDDEDARTLYVAMTRTIDTLVTAELPEVKGRLKPNKTSGRWVHAGWKDWQSRGVEVQPNDVDNRQPAGEYILNEDAVEIQKLLAEDVQVGDPVELHFLRPRIGSPGAAYSVVWNDRPIGLMTEEFGTDLVWILKRASKWEFPRQIVDLSVDAVRSVGGDPMLGEQMGLGPGGAWLAPSLVGMGRFVWKD